MSSLFYEIKNSSFRNEKDFNSVRNKISKINSRNLIDEAIYIGKKLSYKNKQNNNINIKEDLLEEMRAKILKAYLESVKEKTIKEIKTELNLKIEEYIKNIRILLFKSNCEKEEYKKMTEKIEMENNNIKQINASLSRYNQELIEEINNYQSNISTLQKSYDILLKQKDLFEVILREYSGNSPDEILSELKLAKEGSILLLEKYNDIMRENMQMKNEIKNIEKKYENKIESIIKEYNNYKEDKINDEKENNLKIKYLENKLYNNERYQKDNYNLHQTLYYLYNLLFTELSLNKDIKIDKKYLDIKESDFEPNVIYDMEIRNYVELMIKSMHRESMDNIFRECWGHLNMIIRKYFPNKKNLRFKPIETLIEVNNFIDKKMKIINDNKALIEEYKNYFNKLEKENIKINKKLSQDINNNYNYNSLKNNHNSLSPINNENKDINQLNDNVNNTNNYKEPISLSKIYNTNNKTNGVNTISFNNQNSNNLSLFRIRKKGLKTEISKTEEENSLIKNKKLLRRGGLKTLTLLEKELVSEGNIKKNENIFCKINNKTRNKSSNIYKKKALREFSSKDKIIKENGINNYLKVYHDYNFIIEETNRLFLYKSRMNSYNEKRNLNRSLQNKFRDKNNEKKHNIKLRNIDNKNYYYNNKYKDLEKKIYGKINNLIKNIKK